MNSDTPDPHYAKVDHRCYSVARWIREGVSSKESRIQVAGKVEQIEMFDGGAAEVLLTSQGERLTALLTKIPWSLQLNQHIQIDFLVQDYDDSVKKVSEVEAVRLLLSSRAPALKGSVDFFRAKLWQSFVAELRQFFVGRGFVETSTPTLVQCPGMEVELQPFSTEHNWGAQKNRLFLPTSPEIHLKKLLTMGWSEIFEIKKCFRNEELSAHHEPEFWMLEWYRAYSHLEAIVEDVEALILYLSEKGFVVGQPEPLERRSVAELFLQHYNFHLTPKTTYQELRELAYSHSLPVTEEESWDDIFHLLFLLKIEREFGETGPIIVFNYPPSQAALARLTEDGWADRFEVYWRGLELGNAFHELNDPVEQRRRWLKDYQLRQLKGRTQVPIDEEFLQGLEHGMPPSGGIAIGVERLFLACQGLCDLNEVVQFPHNRK